MVKKIKNIFNLTKIFFINSFQNPYIIDKKTNKINKKSIFVWLMMIGMIAMSYLSYIIIGQLTKIGQPQIFLNLFFLILNIIMIFQIILASINVYFFSKDLEIMLPLPLKTEELLISKFNTILINLYFTEIVFALFPLIIYGIMVHTGIFYYFNLILVLILFPILSNLVISIIIMFLIKFSKFIKNKDIFQIIMTLIILIILFSMEFLVVNNVITKFDNIEVETEQVNNSINNFITKIEKINNYFLIINPSIKMLNNYNIINFIFNLLKIIFINLLFFIIFIFVGKKYYLKNILINKNYYIKNLNKKNIEKELKKLNKGKSYIKKEFKLLFKNPIFFMQCIFPTLILIVSIIIIIIALLPNIKAVLSTDIFGEIIKFETNLSIICTLIGIIQIMFTMSNISITSISREGKNAVFMKFIPVDLYKQFIYKSMPQIIINFILCFIITIFIKLIFSDLELVYLFLVFLISNLLNILNSNLMVVADLYRPNLNWDADYEAVKNNNKLFQYALTIILILLISYFYKIFNEINLMIACLLIVLVLIILILILNKIIKINIKKLFKKIN